MALGTTRTCEDISATVLQTLHIRNLALVTELDVEFGAGLNSVTGETGAGKSLILGALQLLLGDRAGPSIIRRGAKQCEIGAVIALGPGYIGVRKAVDSMLAQAGTALCEDSELLLRRVVTRSGSRFFVNGSPVTLHFLRELGDMLVDIHGPHEHQSLLQPRHQLSVLDAYAGLQEQRAHCADVHGQIRGLDAALVQAQSAVVSGDEQELIRHQLREIDTAELVPDEEAQITDRHRIAAHAGRILEVADQCSRGITEGDGSLTEQLTTFVRLVQEIEDADPGRGGEFVQRLEQVSELLQEIGLDLRRYSETLEFDEEQLRSLEARLDQIQRLKRKYGTTVEQILSTADELRVRLQEAEQRRDRLAELRTELKRLTDEHGKQCRALTASRRAAVQRLAVDISAKLKKLGFAQSTFGITLAAGAPGPNGVDQVEFCFAPNLGEEPMPLRQIASSGEIARVMLAIKTVLSAADSIPILIFDEVDANVGGRVAVKVAEELRAIGARHQVFSITHLPQIAAAGDVHFRVSKRVEDGRTIAEMTRLADSEREQEITRMLGAAADSRPAVEHARELLKTSRNRIRPDAAG